MKVILSENQIRRIVESGVLDSVSPALPDFIAEKPLQETNPLALTGYFINGALNRFASEHQREILSNFSDNIDSFEKDEVFSKLGKLINKCRKLEEPIKESLEKICLNTAVKLFAIPSESVIITCKLEEISKTKTFHVKPDTDEAIEYESVEAIDGNDAEINKRRIINALCCGAAQNIAEEGKKMWLPEIFELDEELPHLYSEIMKINEYLIFNTNIKITDKNHKQGGAVELKLSHEDQVSTIEATGIIFPILFQETVRGIIDMIATYGLPDDANAAKRITNIADALETDPWNMRFGPVMWNKVVNCIPKFNTENFPHFFKSLVELNTGDFKNLMREVFAGTKKGKNEIEEIYNSSKYDSEYEKFTDDLAVKQGRDIITDEYFTEEELEGYHY